jgi:hypothetical protein
LKIKIGATTYEVKQVTGLTSFELDGKDTKCDGTINRDLALLELEVNQSKIQKTISLWHEIIHALSWQYSVPLSEDDIDRLAHGVAGVIIENKAVSFL